MSSSDRQPGDLPLGIEGDPLIGPDLLRRVTWAFVGLGVVLRLVTYAMHFPLWGDEAFVAANFISRGYLDLLQPLDYGQICPLLFLWLELTAVKLFGFNEWSLRLVPTMCSVASLFLFAHVAGRLFHGVTRLLAVAIFAVAFYPIRHGAEVKPYITDLLTALALFARCDRMVASPRADPLALGSRALRAGGSGSLSHPAVFVAGGVSLGLSTTAWRLRRRGALLPFSLYNLALVATFLGLLAALHERTNADRRRDVAVEVLGGKLPAVA